MALPGNTTKDVHDDPLSMLAASFFGGSEAAIRSQESAGQQDFIHSDALPSEMKGDCRKILESYGATFGEIDPSDPLFIPCTLPPGWTKKATGHAMWSDLLDDKGRRRGSVFYKAAFYDRKAHMSLATRFSYDDEYRDDGFAPFVTDAGVRIHDIEPVLYEAMPGDEVWQMKSAARTEALRRVDAWFAANYPDWKNPAAYWD